MFINLIINAQNAMAEGGAPVLSLPVTAQGGALYLGPVKLLNLPKILFLVRSR